MKREEDGAVMIEATFLICILMLVLFGFVRLGRTALEEQSVQDYVDFAAWSYETGGHPKSGGIGREQVWLGTRAAIDHGHRKHRSLRIDLGGGWQ